MDGRGIEVHRGTYKYKKRKVHRGTKRYMAQQVGVWTGEVQKYIEVHRSTEVHRGTCRYTAQKALVWTGEVQKGGSGFPDHLTSLSSNFFSGTLLRLLFVFVSLYYYYYLFVCWFPESRSLDKSIQELLKCNLSFLPSYILQIATLKSCLRSTDGKVFFL